MNKEKTYYVYHVPGVKVGVTNRLKKRVEQEQGYSKGEYEIISKHKSDVAAAFNERYWQRFYGYKEDLGLYNHFIKRFTKLNNEKENEMKVNVTRETITFPCAVNKLKGRLMDSIGMVIETPLHGSMVVDEHSIDWIMNNVKVSNFRDSRSFVYNRAFKAYMDERNNVNTCDEEQTVEMPKNNFDLIREWAEQRGIYGSGDVKTQYVKLMEEGGELAQAMLKQNDAGVVDAIGDMVVVLTNLAHMYGYSIEHCINSAYEEIKHRTGKMNNGTFIKDEQ